MWTVLYTVRNLELAHIPHDRCKLLSRYLRLRRHVTVRPMMLRHALHHREKKSLVGMVARIVNIMDQGRAILGARSILAMARCTVCIEGFLSADRLRGKRGHLDVNRLLGGRIRWCFRL